METIKSSSFNSPRRASSFSSPWGASSFSSPQGAKMRSWACSSDLPLLKYPSADLHGVTHPNLIEIVLLFWALVSLHGALYSPVGFVWVGFSSGISFGGSHHHVSLCAKLKINYPLSSFCSKIMWLKDVGVFLLDLLRIVKYHRLVSDSSAYLFIYLPMLILTSLFITFLCRTHCTCLYPARMLSFYPQHFLASYAWD